MSPKVLILLIGSFLSLLSVRAQDKVLNEYEFVNNVYKDYVKKGLAYYYLYYKPFETKFLEVLGDTLSNYINNEDISYIRRQYELQDTSFIWDQDLLMNCRIIHDTNRRELLAKNTHYSVMMRDLQTGQPVKNNQAKTLIPPEEKQFYSFSKPVFNKDNTIAIFSTKMDGGNHGETRTFIYKKVNDQWVKLTTLAGVDWMRN